MAESVSSKVVRLETQMAETNKSLDRIEGKVDTLIDRFEVTSNTFLSKNDFLKYQTSIETEIATLRKKNWVQNTLSAIAGAILLGIAGGFGYFIFIKK